MLLLLASMALAAPEAALPTDPKAPRIVVTGSGTVKTPPNVADLEYEVNGEGETSDQAVKALVSKGAAIENALRSLDPELDLHSDKVKVQGVRRGPCKADDYDETAHLSTGNCAIVGYVATQEFDLRSTKVSDAGTMVGLASRQGATNPSIESFGLADQRVAKQQAIAAALGDARVTAEALAAGSNARLGEIMTISLDDAREQEIVVTGSRVARNSVPPPTPVIVSVAPGPVITTAQVTVTYAIGR
ncbi:SIMPL domain-containing protein [Sphingomonas sp.]|uniref:SIMPL domain-containing protein n=1 Tax=Sphingomonas sp. TaxID=28214 RepID=UPI0025F91619|nr:SIMPL domain-containing protein [Sphingomonas sp.]